MRINCATIAALAASTTPAILLVAPSSEAFAPSLTASRLNSRNSHNLVHKKLNPLKLSATPENVVPSQLPVNQPTELPDSLSDAASIAANACYQLYQTSGPMTRCRVDFDTSIGDETYTTLKSSTDFMQQYVTALCMACIPGVMERKQEEVMKLVKAKAELMELQQEKKEENDTISNESDGSDFDGEMIHSGKDVNDDKPSSGEDSKSETKQREEELLQIIANQGADPENKWTGPKIRIYFPDEGS